ncbi:MAG TPA: GNAT family N-acetyltransferase [Acidimicrobiia bacterium]|nr:GNAT family N-acetyltransferase [Acidimicrobiia bacterium]
MEVVRFTDQYELVAGVYDVAATELRVRDERQGQPLQRWMAVRKGEAVAAVSTWWRPDDRTFLYFVGPDRAAYPLLADVLVDALRRPVHAFADAGDGELVDALRSAGFDVEVVEEGFRVRFDEALAQLRRAWVPSQLSIQSTDAVDEDRLFILDNTLRQDTLGTDGWQRDRAWFHDELAESPPFDPAAYLVAVDDRTGEYVGLVRIWRNSTGPRFGMIGVLPQYRTTTIAGALLRRALLAASEWGHETFTAETSPANPVTYLRMSRVGAESLGQFYQMVRYPPL